MERNNILAPCQFAYRVYRKGRNTELAALKLVNKILENFDNNKISLAVFLDLSRTFDCVNYQILFNKLEYYGITNITLDWFKSYLSHRSQLVSFNGVSSEVKNIGIGVPQGSVLGPLLFLVYMNDLCKLIEQGEQILFADDVTHLDWDDELYVVVQRVNSSLRIIADWFLANKLSLNTIKSEAMIFTRRVIYFPLLPVMISGKPLPYNYFFKFLGLYLDMKLTWSYHLNRIRSKISSAIGVLFRLRNKLTCSVSRIIYLSLCLPYLQYCNTLWSSCSSSKLQFIFTAQKKIVRLILRKNRHHPSSPLFKRLNLLKLKELNEFNAVLLVYKSLNELIVSPVSFINQILGPYNLRRREPLVVPFSRSNQSQRFIAIRGANLWNELPLDIRSCLTVNSFK